MIRKEDGSGEALSYYVINRVVTRWTKRHLDVRLTPHKLRHAYRPAVRGSGRGHPHHR